SSQNAENEGDAYLHLLAVVALGRVMQRRFFIDDASGGLMCAASEARNVCGPLSTGMQLGMQHHSGFGGCLCMEFCRKTNLKQNIFHDIRAVRPLERERLPLERNIIEAPARGRLA